MFFLVFRDLGLADCQRLEEFGLVADDLRLAVRLTSHVDSVRVADEPGVNYPQLAPLSRTRLSVHTLTRQRLLDLRMT